MPIDLRRKLPSLFGRYASHMPTNGGADIQTVPPHQLRPPSDVGIFAVREKVFVEKLACNRNVIDHRTAIQCSCSRRSKNEFASVVLPCIFDATATVKMAKVGTKIHSSRINDVRKGLRSSRLPTQQLAADRADVMAIVNGTNQLG